MFTLKALLLSKTFLDYVTKPIEFEMKQRDGNFCPLNVQLGKDTSFQRKLSPMSTHKQILPFLPE